MRTLREHFETWAKERGHPLCDVIPSYGPASSMPKTELRFSDIAWDAFQAASDLAAKREREECAKLCEAERAEHHESAAKNNGRDSDFAFGSVNSTERIAAAIRARDGGTS